MKLVPFTEITSNVCYHEISTKNKLYKIYNTPYRQKNVTKTNNTTQHWSVTCSIFYELTS